MMQVWVKCVSRIVVLVLGCIFVFSHLVHAEVKAPDGWVVLKSSHSYSDLVDRVLESAKSNKIGVVAQASATVGAKKVLDKTIPGNMVIGLYHPRFAVRMLDASIAAGIEAPIRVYVTENNDGTADLSYKTPSHVFAPYMAEGGDNLLALASELDELFEKLAAEAVGN
ncbi:MAG: DUF302 domain-containing protein [Rhizobiaceae bacterium]